MSLIVTVHNEPFKKVTIKTTPSMSIKNVLDNACEKLSLNPKNYTLKYNKTLLSDLSLSVRFANLPSSAKLVLYPTSSSSDVDAELNIALQLLDQRLTMKFPASTSLWNILLTFEKISNGYVKNFKKSCP